MFLDIWHSFLYQPLFNLLIILYQHNDIYSLGLAVIYLTVILRIFLLPFSFFAQRNKIRYEFLNQEVAVINKDYQYDQEKAKEEIRRVMKKYKIRPWAKAIMLAVQGIVLVALYQVFLGGINNKLDDLYLNIIKPDFINLSFLGINLGERNLYLAVLVGIILFLEIFLTQRRIKNILTKSDVAFSFLFPLSAFAILAVLPSVKSIFILTSIFFTIIVSIILRLFIKALKFKDAK
ncbi:YidC/Oxa1 family membrane protein insertase [Candidatus Parcubacteria bacterium]|nr:YidC/Oxa1 family membrane protein insertase [Candidatus Parcubacteria bacterium]